MKNIIIDTNFIISAIKYKIDIFKELERIINFRYKVIVLNETIKEIENIIEKCKLSDRTAAQIALELIKKNNVYILHHQSKTKSIKNVDFLILDIINKDDYIVATQDKDLKRKIKEKGVSIIVIRQKKYLKLI